MKLLLIQPPIQDFYDTDVRLQPIGLGYLKAVVEKQLPQVTVKIRDFHQGWGRTTTSLPKELNYIRSYYSEKDRSPFSVFHEYFHFGASFERVLAEVCEEAPDLVGISSLFSPYYREVLTIARMIKEELKVPIILGGSHVSAMPEQMLADPSVDFIIRGEGERPLVELLTALTQGSDLSVVSNLGFKIDGQIYLNPLAENYALSELPPPDFSDIGQEAYQFEGRPLTFMLTSRSCPHRCSFCSVHTTFGKRYQRRPPQDVLAEIEQRVGEGFQVIDFEDDNLTFYLDEMKDLCRAMIARQLAKKVEFVAMNGISYLSLDDELLELMWLAGFRRLNLALVTSDITVRETTKRPHTSEKYLSVVAKAHQIGFAITSYQILGLPTESLDSMIQTLTFAASQPVLLGASMFYLTPSSPIARSFPRPAESDVVKSRLTAMAIETEHFRRDHIFTLFISTRILNFLKDCPSAEGEVLPLEEALLRLSECDARSTLGVQLLERLFDEQVLYRATSKGWLPQIHFDWDIFAQVWRHLDCIRTKSGARIEFAGTTAIAHLSRKICASFNLNR